MGLLNAFAIKRPLFIFCRARLMLTGAGVTNEIHNHYAVLCRMRRAELGRFLPLPICDGVARPSAKSMKNRCAVKLVAVRDCRGRTYVPSAFKRRALHVSAR